MAEERAVEEGVATRAAAAREVVMKAAARAAGMEWAPVRAAEAPQPAR